MHQIALETNVKALAGCWLELNACSENELPPAERYERKGTDKGLTTVRTVTYIDRNSGPVRCKPSEDTALSLHFDPRTHKAFVFATYLNDSTSNAISVAASVFCEGLDG